MHQRAKNVTASAVQCSVSAVQDSVHVTSATRMVAGQQANLAQFAFELHASIVSKRLTLALSAAVL